MSDRSRRERRASVIAPAELGLPEHSALTVEGRIERAGMAGNYLARRRRGQEGPLRRSQWALGLWLIFWALMAVLVATVVAFLV
jgi:hypothetical protein